MKTLREEALEKTKELLLNYEIQQDTILFNGAHIADLSKDELLKVIDVLSVICFSEEQSDSYDYVNYYFSKVELKKGE